MKQLFTFAFFLVLNFSLISQENITSATTNNLIEMGAGISYGYAPTLKVDGISSSGNIWSIFGDLVLNKKYAGRIQYSRLLPGSLSEEFKGIVTSGMAINGSMGIQLNLNDEVSAMVMGTLGYASIKKNRGFSSQQQGMQYGITVSPKYYINERVVAHSSIRHLLGSNAQQGNKLGQTDISIGVMILLSNG